MKLIKSWEEYWIIKGKLSLKVKIKSLAEEAKIIRAEEEKIVAGNSIFWIRTRTALRHHRINEVRKEARAALLAYAMIRGVPYHLVERPKSRELDIKAVQRIVDKFGTRGMSVVDWVLKSQFKVA
jgi:hypothetical protein